MVTTLSHTTIIIVSIFILVFVSIIELLNIVVRHLPIGPNLHSSYLQTLLPYKLMSLIFRHLW